MIITNANDIYAALLVEHPEAPGSLQHLLSSATPDFFDDVADFVRATGSQVVRGVDPADRDWMVSGPRLNMTYDAVTELLRGQGWSCGDDGSGGITDDRTVFTRRINEVKHDIIVCWTVSEYTAWSRATVIISCLGVTSKYHRTFVFKTLCGEIN